LVNCDKQRLGGSGDTEGQIDKYSSLPSFAFA